MNPTLYNPSTHYSNQTQTTLPLPRPGYYSPLVDPPVTTDLIFHEGSVYRKFVGDGFEAYKREAVTMAKPKTRWRGKPIPNSVLHQIYAFFEWGYQQYKCEQVVRLFYNQVTEEWKAWAFPQEGGQGLAVSEIENNPRFETERAAIGRGFSLYGSIHHHCSAGAFQSGTDRNDEKGWSGIHFTVGKIGSPTYDLHARVVIGNDVQTDVNLAEWFEVPEVIRNAVAPSLRDALAPIALSIACTPPPAGTEVPQAWKDNVMVREYAPVTQTYHYTGHNHNGHLPNNSLMTASEYAWQIKVKNDYQFKKDFEIVAGLYDLDSFDAIMYLIRENYKDIPVAWAFLDTFPAKVRAKKLAEDKAKLTTPADVASTKAKLLEDAADELEAIVQAREEASPPLTDAELQAWADDRS